MSQRSPKYISRRTEGFNEDDASRRKTKIDANTGAIKTELPTEKSAQQSEISLGQVSRHMTDGMRSRLEPKGQSRKAKRSLKAAVKAGDINEVKIHAKIVVAKEKDKKRKIKANEEMIRHINSGGATQADGKPSSHNTSNVENKNKKSKGICC